MESEKVDQVIENAQKRKKFWDSVKQVFEDLKLAREEDRKLSIVAKESGATTTSIYNNQIAWGRKNIVWIIIVAVVIVLIFGASEPPKRRSHHRYVGGKRLY
jgi:hypothetical protein